MNRLMCLRIRRRLCRKSSAFFGAVGIQFIKLPTRFQLDEHSSTTPEKGIEILKGIYDGLVQIEVMVKDSLSNKGE